jgi:hypothetical protein
MLLVLETKKRRQQQSTKATSGAALIVHLDASSKTQVVNGAFFELAE